MYLRLVRGIFALFWHIEETIKHCQVHDVVHFLYKHNSKPAAITAVKDILVRLITLGSTVVRHGAKNANKKLITEPLILLCTMKHINLCLCL